MKFLGVFLTLVISTSAWATSDYLGSTSIGVSGSNAEAEFDAVATNIKSVFKLYQPVLDSSSTIVTPYAVSGSATNPTITVSVQKCIAFICETVDLDARVSLSETKGSCDRNLILDVDLSRSSSNLTAIYSAIQVDICVHADPKGGASMDVKGYAIQAPSYSQGVVTDQLLSFLKMQIDPMMKAFTEAL